jgi:phosphoserine phosphatase
MALDIERFGERLATYAEVLERHNRQVRDDYEALHAGFRRLFSFYAGEQAEELARRWQRSADWFEHYLRHTEDLRRFLDERSASLPRR